MPAPLFNARTVAALAALNAASLPHAAVIAGPTYTAAHGAQQVHYDTPRLSGVPCRVSIPALSGGELVTAEQLRALSRYTVVFAAGTDVRELDRLTVTGTDAAGRAFTLVLDVVTVGAPLAVEAMRKTVCQLVRTPATVAPGAFSRT